METYKLLTGERLSLSTLTEAERAFLLRLTHDAKPDVDYFDLLRQVKGPKALPLCGGPITPTIAASPLYRIAHDIVDRIGIEQGYLLAADIAKPVVVKDIGNLLSLTEAANLIGITRPAAHQAVLEERLHGQRVGNAWVIARADADAFKQARSKNTADAKNGQSAPLTFTAGSSRR